jgi:hypothetical protein
MMRALDTSLLEEDATARFLANARLMARYPSCMAVWLYLVYALFALVTQPSNQP